MDKKEAPLTAVIKCEVCMNLVTNFVAGLCQRCENIWAKQPESTPVTSNRILATIVASVRQSDGPMDPTFQKTMIDARSEKVQKLQIFNKIRSQFTNSVLAVDPSSQMAEPFQTGGNYWNIPEMMNRDVIAFQRDVDLLADMVPHRNRSSTGKDRSDKDEDSGLPE